MSARAVDVRAVSFDFGQTLAELDTGMLARRLGERGRELSPGRLEGAVPGAWRAYDEAIHRGLGGHPWKVLMTALLEGAGMDPSEVPARVDWLWDEQPRANLWRRPVAGMIELVEGLARAGVPVAVISNSEGGLEALARELGWERHFAVIADSGRLGIEKPDPGIFAWTALRLGVRREAMVHVGDSWAADVEGALGAGMRAIWFTGSAVTRALPPGVRVCSDAARVGDALRAWGVDA